MAKSKRARRPRRNPVTFKNGKTYFPEKCSKKAARRLLAERAFEKTHGVKMRKRIGSCTPKDAAVALRYGTNGSKFEPTRVRNARIRAARARRRGRGRHVGKTEAQLKAALAACAKTNVRARRELLAALKELRAGRRAAKGASSVSKKSKKSKARRARRNPYTTKKGRHLRTHCTVPKAEKVLHTRGSERKAHKRLTRGMKNADGTVCTSQSASAVVAGHGRGRGGRKAAAGRKSAPRAKATVYAKTTPDKKGPVDRLMEYLGLFEPLGFAGNAVV